MGIVFDILRLWVGIKMILRNDLCESLLQCKCENDLVWCLRIITICRLETVCVSEKCRRWNEWLNCNSIQLEAQLEGWTYERTDRRTDRQTSGQTDRFLYIHSDMRMLVYRVSLCVSRCLVDKLLSVLEHTISKINFVFCTNNLVISSISRADAVGNESRSTRHTKSLNCSHFLHPCFSHTIVVLIMQSSSPLPSLLVFDVDIATRVTMLRASCEWKTTR